jgi:hypothetical protein
MAATRNSVIGALRTAGITTIAAGIRHHARDSSRPLALSASPNDFAAAPTTPGGTTPSQAIRVKSQTG